MVITVATAILMAIGILMKSKNIVDFIQKPFDIQDLLKKVKKLVG